MATPSRDISHHISSNISSKINKWVLRATSLVKEKKKNSNSTRSQFYCKYPDPEFTCASDEQRSQPVDVPKSTMSSSRPRQRKLSNITSPNLEKIVELPRRTRKMSAPCSPQNFEFQLEDKTLKRNAHSGSNICKESHRGNFLSDMKSFQSPSFYNAETGGLNSANVNDREINNNDNDCLLKEPRECTKLSFIGVNEQETRNHFVNSIGDAALNNKCLVNNARGDDRKANRTILHQENQAGINTDEESKSSCIDSNSPPLLSNHLGKTEDLTMPVLSQQITARLQKWVESATKRALARERKYSEDSISSNSSNNESISPGTQGNSPWGTRSEPAKPSEIRELESAIKELVTGVGSKGSLNRGMVAQSCTRSPQESLSQASDCSDSGCRLSDSRSDDLSDCTAGKDEIDALSDDRIISKIAGLTNVSSEQSSSVTSKTGRGNDANLSSSNQPIGIDKGDTSSGLFESPENKIIKDRSNEPDDIKYAKSSTLKETNKTVQQVNKSGMTTRRETIESIKEEMNSNKNEFEEKKVPTIVEPATLDANNFRNNSRGNEKGKKSFGTNRQRSASINTSDEEKSGQERKLPKQKPPPRPPRPNFAKRFTSPNSESLKVRNIPKRESLPAIFDFKDTDLAEFAQTCVRQANKKEKRFTRQKKATGSENNKHESQNGNVDNKQNSLNPSPDLERLKTNQTSESVKRGWSLEEQKSIETQVLNEEELYHEFEKIHQEPFSHVDGEKSLNFFEKLSKGKKDGSPKTSRLHKFPSLPMFYRPKSPKTTTVPEKSKERRRKFSHSSNKSKSSETDDSVTEQVDPASFRYRSDTMSDDSKTPELGNGRRRSGTMPIHLKDHFHSQSPSDPFYHGLEPTTLANGARRSTVSADSLLIDISPNETSENQRETAPNTDHKSSNDHKTRRRKVSAPCLPIPYVEELV